MSEYVFEDLIMNPETPNLESLIGKEVYYSNTPLYCLNHAKCNCKTGILKEIQKDSNLPFWVDNRDGAIVNYACILPKKEEPKPEFIPFTSADEFIDVYDSKNFSVQSGTIENKLLYYGGIWLKDKETDAWFMVTEIWDEGVVVGDGKLRTVSNGDNEYFTMNDVTDWRELLRDYTFLDATPCGKEVK